MDDELFQVKMRTIAISSNKQRPKKIIDDISRLFNQYNYIGLNTIKFNKTKNLKKFAKNYVMRLFYSDNTLLDDLKNFKKTTILNIKELSSIIHFPH
jgi:DNA-binding transcriptional regulator WhiA